MTTSEITSKYYFDVKLTYSVMGKGQERRGDQSIFGYLIFVVTAELSRAPLTRSRAPWVRKYGNPCFQEILVLRNRPYGVRAYVRPPLPHVSGYEIAHFEFSLLSAYGQSIIN